jgi:hypothetical protein
MSESTDNKVFDISKRVGERVTVRNTTSIETWFKCLEKSMDAVVPPKGRIPFPISEILLQCESHNPDFVGYNYDGKHATFYLEDKDLRIYLGFESENGKNKQEVIDEQSILNMFDAANLATFVDLLKDKIVTNGEKQTLRDVLESGKVNAFDRIEAAKSYLKGDPIEIPKNKSGRPPKAKAE